MEKLIIHGPKTLNGKVKISGAKNSAVALIPAALLSEKKVIIDNVPNISDLHKYYTILEELGVKITHLSNSKIQIDSSNIHNFEAISDNVKQFRASYYLLGTLLAKNGYVKVGLPGGCNIGERPIDQHILGFKKLGATVIIDSDNVTAKSDKLIGNEITFDVVSVGATINVMIAATKAIGITVLKNVAKEPHVVDVANFLNALGANIVGAGTDTITINGVNNLNNEVQYTVIPDQIEAGTFLVAGAISGGEIEILNCIPQDLECIISPLKSAGVNIQTFKDSIKVNSNNIFSPINIITEPHPGFPTDLQSQIGVLLSLSNGTSTLTEQIWESRFTYIDELNKMGANIIVNDKTAVFNGVNHLKGAKVKATDLRAGAALVIAGIIADGTTEITNINYIDRGYENIEDKFRKLGANIERVVE